MDKARILGGNRLVGVIPISGAKNAALPLMAASLLTDQALVLHNVPCLADTDSMSALLSQLGAKVRGQPGISGQALALNSAGIVSTEATYDIVRKMRASILVLGPLLARFGRARVSLPGGCAIGNRPINLHLQGLRDMGAEIAVTGGYVDATAPEGGRLRGASITLPAVSVGATENLMMAATLAHGETVLVNAAREPEIVDLAECLTAMGATIEGQGSERIHIQGSARLDGASHLVLPDRIEAGTYAMAACMTGGNLELVGIKQGMLDSVFDTLCLTGATVETTTQGVRVTGPGDVPRCCDVMTAPFPGFPTDLQAQLMAYMTRAGGASMITETIFENRFMHVSELRRLGADITVHHASALVRGVPSLTGAPVMATDLRASVCLVLAGLVADGETVINRIYHLDRGYERLFEKLRNCGADIQRVSDKNRDVQDQVA